MRKIDEDVLKAGKTILGGIDSSFVYNDSSYIYRCTNENMKNNTYKQLISNNENVLSVIGSGDQILNMFLLNSNNIDAFDISRFPSYFLRLKIAAIKEFNYEEYLSFFFDNKAFDKKLFNRLMDSCEDEECKEFWSRVCYMNPKLAYYSPLFADTRRTSMYAISNNPYLDKFYYYKLKDKIDNINIKYITGDILDIGPKLDKDYDLIYLSNICIYAKDMFNNYDDMYSYIRFRDFITNLRINPSGKIINYLHRTTEGRITYRIAKEVFNKKGFTTYEVKKDKEPPDSLVVYRKVR